MRKFFLIPFLSGLLITPSVVMIADITLLKPVKAERLAFSKKVQDIFWRFDFQYEKYKEYGAIKDWDLACEYAKRAYQILVNNYSELDNAMPKGGWGSRRASLSRTVQACSR